MRLRYGLRLQFTSWIRVRVRGHVRVSLVVFLFLLSPSYISFIFLVLSCPGMLFWNRDLAKALLTSKFCTYSPNISLMTCAVLSLLYFRGIVCSDLFPTMNSRLALLFFAFSGWSFPQFTYKPNFIFFKAIYPLKVQYAR